MRYALVTGGSRGLGRAICVKLAQDGLPVIINYQSNENAAKETARLVEEVGGKAELLPFDVSKPEEIENALENWQNAHKGDYIAVLVNNACILRDNLMVFMQNEQWHSVIDTSLNGFFYTTRRLLKNMMTKRFGRIINISSLSGLKGLPGQTNYSAAKAALIGATKALAQEVGAKNVTVNAVAPGFFDTDMTKGLPAGMAEAVLKMIPVGRFGKPEEVGDLVSFLASEKSSYITGQVISINGGLYA